MRILVTSGDILDVAADVLICSANVFLNLSGGVGGAIRMKFGDAVADRMQRELHQHLAQRGVRHVQQGETVVTGGEGTAFRVIVHAVAVDGMYESSPEVVTKTLRASLVLAAGVGAKSVAMTAVATGYGRLKVEQFAQGVAPLAGESFENIEKMTICVRHADEATRIAGVLGAAGIEAMVE